MEGEHSDFSLVSFASVDDLPARGPVDAYTVTKVMLGDPSKSVPLSLCVYTSPDATQSAARDVFISLCSGPLPIVDEVGWPAGGIAVE